MTTFCTIVDSSYLKQALVCRQTFLEFNATGRFYILVTNLKKEFIRNDFIKTLSELIEVYPELDQLRDYYDIVEFSTALKPYFLDFLREINQERITFVDPDTQFFSSASEIINSSSSKEILVTPHRFTPSDGVLVDDRTFLKYGIYNLGFISIGQETQHFLKWWQEKLLRHSTRYRNSEIFTDQKWIDLAQVYFEIRVVKHYGIDVAPWNLDERSLEMLGESWYCADGNKLIFFHFSQISQLINSGDVSAVLKNFGFGKIEEKWLQSLEKLVVDYSMALQSIPNEALAYPKIEFVFLKSELARRVSRKISGSRRLGKYTRNFMLSIDKFLVRAERSEVFREIPILAFRDFMKLRSKIR